MVCDRRSTKHCKPTSKFGQVRLECLTDDTFSPVRGVAIDLVQNHMRRICLIPNDVEPQHAGLAAHCCRNRARLLAVEMPAAAAVMASIRHVNMPGTPTAGRFRSSPAACTANSERDFQ